MTRTTNPAEPAGTARAGVLRLLTFPPTPTRSPADGEQDRHARALIAKVSRLVETRPEAIAVLETIVDELLPRRAR